MSLPDVIKIKNVFVDVVVQVRQKGLLTFVRDRLHKCSPANPFVEMILTPRQLVAGADFAFFWARGTQNESFGFGGHCGGQKTTKKVHLCNKQWTGKQNSTRCRTQAAGTDSADPKNPKTPKSSAPDLKNVASYPPPPNPYLSETAISWRFRKGITYPPLRNDILKKTAKAGKSPTLRRNDPPPPPVQTPIYISSGVWVQLRATGTWS